ncbi:MAG: outer membrane lipoprotein-sorting protein [Spirochaetaceae bacterium]|nr:MAG: outer membrane lipoprotein-sorting protein [Spirochaetaceae bacterium]
MQKHIYNVNRTIFLLVLFALTLAIPLAIWAEASPRPTIAGSRSILEGIDRLVSYDSDYSAEYTITQDRPGQGTSVTKAAMFRRDPEDKYLILIMEPEIDKGKGYLKIGSSLWLYDPVASRFTVTSSRDRFQNTNARNSDFTRSTLATDYRIVSSSEQQLGVYETKVYELEATNDSVTYPMIKIWVDENQLVRKMEDYSLSGQLMRTTAIPNYQRLDDQFVPVNIVIIDALQGRTINGKFRNERTIIAVTKPSLRDLPDMVFTQAYLERVSQ